MLLLISYFKHEYLRSRADTCLSLSSPSSQSYSNYATIEILLLVSWIPASKNFLFVSWWNFESSILNFRNPVRSLDFISIVYNYTFFNNICVWYYYFFVQKLQFSDTLRHTFETNYVPYGPTFLCRHSFLFLDFSKNSHAKFEV